MSCVNPSNTFLYIFIFIWIILTSVTIEETSKLSKSHPFPATRDFKRNFILCNLRQWLFFLNLAILDKLSFLSNNLLIKFISSSFFWSLFHQLALHSHLQNTLFHILWEFFIKYFQLRISLVILVDIWKNFFNLGNDAVLLF